MEAVIPRIKKYKVSHEKKEVGQFEVRKKCNQYSCQSIKARVNKELETSSSNQYRASKGGL